MAIDIVKQIETVLDSLRPALQSDGGDLEFVSFDDGIVKIKLVGACVNCPISFYTLKFGIEKNLKESVADVREVVLAN